MRGDVEADPQSDEAAWSDDDGADGEGVADQVRELSCDDGSDDVGVVLSSGADAASDVADFGGSERCPSEVHVDVPPPPDPVGRRPPRKRRVLKSETLRCVPDTRRGHNAKVEDQSHMERVFAAYFSELVSEWNPCCDDNGNVRYKWDQEVRAHDVEVDVAGVDGASPAPAR